MWTQIAERQSKHAESWNGRRCLRRSAPTHGVSLNHQVAQYRVQMTIHGRREKKSWLIARITIHIKGQYCVTCGMHVYWKQQTELFCDFPPPQEVIDAGLHRCYVCKAMYTEENPVTLKRCLMCRDIYMCCEHWRRLACLDSFAVVCCRHSRYTLKSGCNPYGGFALIQGFPKGLPKQERWQHLNNVSVDYGRTYCPGSGPHNVEWTPPPTCEYPPVTHAQILRLWGEDGGRESPSDAESGSARRVRNSARASNERMEAEDVTLSYDLTTSSSRPDVSAADPSSGSTLADEGQASRTAMPAMSSAGPNEATGEASSGGALADEGQLPDAEMSDASSGEPEEAPMDPTLLSMGSYYEENFNSCSFAVGVEQGIALRNLWKTTAGFGNASIIFVANVAKKLDSSSQRGCQSCGAAVMIMITFLTRLAIGKGVFRAPMESVMTTDQQISSGTKTKGNAEQWTSPGHHPHRILRRKFLDWMIDVP
eukprot:5443276-Amphidinium_carterae.4